MTDQKRTSLRSRSYSRQDGTVFYRKAIRIHGEKIEKTFSRKLDAEKWYAEKKREKELLENGLNVATTEITVAEFAKTWLQTRKDNGKPLSSWESDEQRLRKFILPKFKSRELRSISTREWETFLDGLVASESISGATRNRIRALANKMYNDAVRQEFVLNNPVRVIPKLRESMDAWAYWTSREEILNYLFEAKEESLAFWIFANLALNTGARIGEILALDHCDIDLGQRRIHIAKVYEETSGTVQNRTKGHKARWLGISDALANAIAEYRSSVAFKRPNDPVVCSEHGDRLYERIMRAMHTRVCKRAAVKPIRIHDLRHTYASHYVMNGGGLAELQSLLGHSSPSMTLKYAHLAPGFLQSRANVVSFGVQDDNVVRLKKK